MSAEGPDVSRWPVTVTSPSLPTGGRNTLSRRLSLSWLLTGLHFDGPATRSEIGATSGLTRSSVATLVGDLEAAGLVRETPMASSGRPGRPSPKVSVTPNKAMLALQISLDELSAAVVGLGGSVLARTGVAYDGSASPRQVARQLVELAETCALEAGRDVELLGAGVAAPGLIDARSGIVLAAPNLGWRDVPFADLVVEAGLDRGPISVANTADLACRAEWRRGAGRGYGNLVFVSGEVGVGGGLIIAGAPLTGSSGIAGEIGHIPVNPDGTKCGCGAIGCWETEVGRPALLGRAGVDPQGGADAHRALIARAEAGDPRALTAFAETGRWLAIGLVGLINTVNPEAVVLGGQVYRDGFVFLEPGLRAELDRRDFPPLETVIIMPGALGESAPILGAAELAFETLLSDPLGWTTD